MLLLVMADVVDKPYSLVTRINGWHLSTMFDNSASLRNYNLCNNSKCSFFFFFIELILLRPKRCQYYHPSYNLFKNILVDMIQTSRDASWDPRSMWKTLSKKALKSDYWIETPTQWLLEIETERILNPWPCVILESRNRRYKMIHLNSWYIKSRTQSLINATRLINHW